MAKQAQPASKPDPRYEALRSLLIEARKANGLTQVALGERLGKEQTWISKYESGRRQLDVIEYLDIVRAIGADPFRLLRKLEDDASSK